MLVQQRREFRELLNQELTNNRGRILVINKPVINGPILNDRVNDGPIPTHATTVQEGNSDFGSNQGPPPPEELEVRITMLLEAYESINTL